MKTLMTILTLAAMGLAVPAAALGDDILTPYGYGTASGSAYCAATGAFNEQPTWDTQSLVPIGDETDPYANTNATYVDRFWYIDFGPDWQDVRITGAWTRYKPYTSATYTGFAALWWDDDIDCTNDGTTESTLNFGTGSLSTGNVQVWLQDADCSGSPITPIARYLVISTGSSPGGRANEYCFIGYVASNAAPSVDAGSDQLVSLASGATLDATVSDDGEPDPPGAVSVIWTQGSGPGTATFTDDEAVYTTVSFSVSGVYVLRLTADDGDLDAYDEITITVNAPPTADAGEDEQITLPTDSVVLDGSASDDGIPTTPGSLTTTWTKQSGPGTVSFDDDGELDAEATFSAAGQYVLRLTADDGGLETYDEVAITVNAAVGSEAILSVGSGEADGSGYFPLNYAFDAQPTWDDVNGIPVSTSGGSGVVAYANRYGYIDFGADWQFIRITQAWTRYTTNTTGDQHGFGSLWWDDDIDTINDEGYDETVLNFNTAQGLSTGGTEPWVRDLDASSAPVAPAGRYLICASGSSMTGRAQEFVMLGYTFQPTKGVITPYGAGAAWGVYPLDAAFDAQPTWDSQNEEPTGGTGGSDVPSTADRYGYIDFGPDYRKVRITETWTRYAQYTTGDQSGYSEIWWDDDTDNWNDGIDETTLAFCTAQGLNTGATEPWVQDAAVSDQNPIVPSARYLIVKTQTGFSDRAKEFAFVGWISDVAAHEPPAPPTPPLLTLDQPQVFDYQNLTLVDEVDCGDVNESHTLYESANGDSEVQMILGDQCRVIPNVGEEPKYFAYKIGAGCDLEAGKAYVLVVEYPDDRSRSIMVCNYGCETNRGFHTGFTAGDCLTAPYVATNCESISYGFSGEYKQWQELFHLNDHTPDITKGGTRPNDPEDGFYVVIAQFRESDCPMSNGAAVRRIALYEAPSQQSYTQALAELPEGLPKRHMFWREEMSDGIVQGSSDNWGLDDPIDFYRYKARLEKFLGMNTFCKDLLEFGHCQDWDISKYPGWYVPSAQPYRWEQILVMLANEGYDLDVLPYYEYTGSTGNDGLGLGKLKRAEPLSGWDHYTGITWSEVMNIDVSDPDAVTDSEKLLEVTITDLADGNRPVPKSITGTLFMGGGESAWAYIDFGPDWDDVRITESWTRSRMYHPADPSPYQAVYWNSTTAGFSGDTVPQGAVAETTINFITQTQSGGGYYWTRDFQVSPGNAITPQARYLCLRAADTVSACVEFCLVGWVEDGGDPEIQTLVPSATGSITGHYINRLFDNQPEYNTKGVNVLGAWWRTRVSAIPNGFSDTTLERFRQDISYPDPVTRSTIESQDLLDDYYDWWNLQRRDYVLALRDYLKTNVDSDSMFLYTWDNSESGPTHPDAPGVVCDYLPRWGDIVEAMTYDDAVTDELHLEAMQLPVKTWGLLEWNHSIPRGDPWNYTNDDDVMMAYVFNKLYTVPESDWLDQYRNGADQLAITRHYCLNEDTMTDSQSNEIVGYFVCDMEVAGPYCMLPEARAVAYGDPYYIGYLSSNNFNRGFPGYVREFNANFLALPALPMVDETGATSEDGVVVRSISTDDDGTWLAIINTSLDDKYDVEITLPVSGTVTDAVTGSAVTVTSGKITLDLWPGRLKSVHIDD